MILLDTNVISELMSGRQPSPVVVAWFNSVSALPFYISTITETELLRGVAAMPAGKRRNLREVEINDMLNEDFADSILAYDSRAARAYAEIEAHRRSIGRPIQIFDCQIAAIAKVHGLSIATRNVADFESCGLEIINPWTHR